MIFNVSVEKVDGDDHGDKHWQYLARVTSNGMLIFEDYYHEKPTRDKIMENAREYVSLQTNA